MRRYQENEDNPKYRERMEQFMDQEVCPDCSGSRLNEEARNVRLMDKNLADLGGFSLYTLFQWLTEVQQHMKELGSTFASAWQLANELNQQLHHFVELGVGYLSLIRPMTALSGGELRRLKLASLLDSDLTGMLYILDEPTIGLHERDTENLMKNHP